MGKDDKSVKTKGSKGSSTNRAQEIHQEKIAHLQKLLEEKGLNFEIEYWALGYNVLRFVSGMCAPIFYI